jgi:hypothetical protein
MHPFYIQLVLDLADLGAIQLSGECDKVSQSEYYELSPDEWYRRRTEAFAQLRKVGFIPGQLLDLVEHFKEQTLVQAFVYKPTEKVELRVGVKVLGKQEEGRKARRLAEMPAAHKRMQDNDEKEGMTSSETLAFSLRVFLRVLKHAEKNRKAAPVRTLNLVPRSLIAEIALYLLESCQTWGYPPGPWLNSLMRELLNLERYRQGMSRDIETQERAAYIVAQAPKVGTRELARTLHVNASTISRWRRSPEFKQMVERKKEVLEVLKAQPLLPPRGWRAYQVAKPTKGAEQAEQHEVVVAELAMEPIKRAKIYRSRQHHRSR